MQSNSVKSKEIFNPRLAAVAGPLSGKTVNLTGRESSIGRGPTNTIFIDNASVSRRHCVIQRDHKQLVIRDLGSLNGTFVNAIPIRERVLQDGDHVYVGDSVFVVVFDDKEELPVSHPEPISIDDSTMVSLKVVNLSSETTVVHHKDDPITMSPRSKGVEESLNTLLRFNTSISLIQTADELRSRLLTSVSEIVPSEHGAYLQLGPDEKEVELICGWDRKTGVGANVQPSTTIVKQVLRNRHAVLAKGILQGSTLGEARSLANSDVRSVICVPLETRGKIVGLIYMATTDRASQFNEDHLQLMTAIGSVAAVAMQNARQMDFLKEENQRLQSETNLNHEMVGESSVMRQVYQLVERVAQSDATVLICGESGTGKELVARAIHQNSSRMDKPFVAINCAAIPETLLESELFGTEKGAYTGATLRKGKLESAEGGTILLDEIGELPLQVQAKLLRVLQERKFERLGGTRSIPVNVRWLAATNRDLKESARNRTFREDLYFRLQVITLRIPPLRDRPDDIPLLAAYFVLRFSKMCGRSVNGISPPAMARLIHHDWPGNVRELANTIERAVVIGSGAYVLADDLNEELFEKAPPLGTNTPEYHEAVKQAKRRIVRSALDQASGNVTEAAQHLGLHPNNLHRLIRNLDIAVGK